MRDQVERMVATSKDHLIIMNLLELFDFINKRFRNKCRLFLELNMSGLQLDIMNALQLGIDGLKFKLDMGKIICVDLKWQKITTGFFHHTESRLDIDASQIHVQTCETFQSLEFFLGDLSSTIQLQDLIKLANQLHPIQTLLTRDVSHEQLAINRIEYSMARDIGTLESYKDGEIYESACYDQVLTTLLKIMLKQHKEDLDQKIDVNVSCDSISAELVVANDEFQQQSAELKMKLGVQVSGVNKRKYSINTKTYDMTEYAAEQHMNVILGVKSLDIQLRQNDIITNSRLSLRELGMTIDLDTVERYQHGQIQTYPKITCGLVMTDDISINLSTGNFRMYQQIMKQAMSLQSVQEKARLSAIPYLGQKYKQFNYLLVPRSSTPTGSLSTQVKK